MTLLTGLIIIWCLLLSILILARNVTHPAHRSMSALCFLLATWAAANWLSLQPISLQLRFFWIKVVMAVTIFIPWLFLHFTVYFPEYEDQQRRAIRRVMPLLLGWTMILVSGAFTPLMFQHFSVMNGVARLQPNIGVLFYGLTFVCIFLLGVRQLYRSYQTAVGLPKTQAAYILLGLCSTALIGFVTNFLWVVLRNDLTYVALGPVSTLFFVTAVGYALLRHRLMDIQWTIIRGVGYLVVLTFAIVGYVGFWHVVVTALGLELSASERQGLALLGTLGVAFSIPSVLHSTQRLGKTLFSITVFDRVGTQLRIATIITQAVTAEQLRRGVEEILHAELQLVTCSILRWGKPTQYAKLFRYIEKKRKDELGSGLIVFDELPESDLKRILREHQVMVLVPLVLQHELLGWVVLGQKKSGNAFSAQELAFCQITAPQIALGLHHAATYGRTRAFNRRLKKEVQNATRELIEANLQLSQIDQLKDEFVSIASHELRTPMTAIRSYLWLCLQHGSHALPENVARHLHIAYDATDRLLALVKELLTVSQLEAGKLTLSLEPVRASFLVRSVIDVLSVSAAEKHVSIELYAEDEEVDVLLDRVKFSEVMQNLIGNAVKFSPSHSHVIVSINREERQIKITVKDQGKGISQEDQKHLFQKFGVVQHQYKTVAQQGTGLGLYIAKQFVQLHSGTIKVRSAPGAGTMFVVVLPLSPTRHNSTEERSHALALSAVS